MQRMIVPDIVHNQVLLFLHEQPRLRARRRG